MTSFFLNVLVVAIQASETVPPPPPPPPGPQTPIDGGVWLLLLLGILYGAWILYKRKNAINKAS